jgi:SAM-dependent methyltransferase
MHLTVKRTFDSFVANYLDSSSEIEVLEFGSQNFNGGLRELKSQTMRWHGVDLSEGPGVDSIIEIGGKYPFKDSTFDLVVASSVFEHDIQFWNSFLEMVRVVKEDGLVLLIMPSQGAFHRYPLDAFRFYPDAGLALSKWSDFNHLPINLIESFTTQPENGEVWSDFVSIFSKSLDRIPKSYLGLILNGENWILNGELIESTFQELPWELRKIRDLNNLNLKIHDELEFTKRQLIELSSSKSWKYTYPFRLLIKYLRNFI